VQTAVRGRLVGWKAIGAFIGRDARTAKRWERERAMPVSRAPGGRRPTVWADPGALQRWLGGAPDPERLGAAAAPVSAQADQTAFADDPAGEDLLLRARFAANCRTPAGLDTAMALYERLAIARPNAAVAQTGMAECYLLAREFGTVPEPVAYAKAAAFSARALAKNPASADAIRILGFIDLWGSGEAELGLERLRRAAELAPGDARAHHWLATGLGATGAFDDALAEFERARRIDPNSTAVLADRALIQFASGQREPARATLEELNGAAPAFSAAHAYLAMFALVENRDCDVPDHLGREARLRGDQDGIDLSERLRAAFSAGGATVMRRTLAAGREILHQSGRTSAFLVARAWAAAGEPERASRWANLCLTRREPGLAALRGDFFLNHYLGRHRGFAAIAAA
jgi:tetratricopeptide (TPR) repeat protein